MTEDGYDTAGDTAEVDIVLSVRAGAGTAAGAGAGIRAGMGRTPVPAAGHRGDTGHAGAQRAGAAVRGIFGLACDLLSPVAGLPCFYALAFLLGAAAAWLLSGQVIMAGVVCSLVVTGVCMLLCGLLHMAVLAGHSGAGLTAAGLLLGRELLVSLPFAAAAHPLFRWAQRRTLSE